MKKNLEQFADQTILKARKRKVRRRILALLSVFVLFVTTNQLIFAADTLEHIAACGLAEHTHTEACYGPDGELNCGLKEHEHTDACYQERPKAEAKDAEEPVDAEDEDEETSEEPYELDEFELGAEEEEEVLEEVGFQAEETQDYEYTMGSQSRVSLDEILEKAGLSVEGSIDVGQVVDEGHPEGMIRIERDGNDIAIVPTRDFKRVELAVMTDDAFYTVNLLNAVAPEEASEDDAAEAETEETVPVTGEEAVEAEETEEQTPVGEYEEETEVGGEADAAEENAPADENEDEVPGEDAEAEAEAEDTTETENTTETIETVDNTDEETVVEEAPAAEEGENENKEEAAPAEDVTEEPAADEGENDNKEETTPAEDVNEVPAAEEGENENNEETAPAEDVNEESAVDESENVEEAAPAETEEESAAEPDAEEASEAAPAEEEEAEVPAPVDRKTIAATIDLSGAVAPFSLKAWMAQAQPEEEAAEAESVEEEAAVEEETKVEEEAAEEAPEALPVDAWTLEYDAAVFAVEPAEADYIVTPLCDFESAAFAVETGDQRIELTLTNWTAPEEALPEAAEAVVYAATIDLADAAAPFSLADWMAQARPEDAEEPVPAEEWEIEYDEAIFTVDPAEGDYSVTPAADFEEAAIAVKAGEVHYELTLVNYTAAVEVSEVLAGKVAVDVEGAEYSLLISVPEAAELPADATFKAVAVNDETYNIAALGAIERDEGMDYTVLATFDLTIYDGETPIQPKAALNVGVDFGGKLDADMQVVAVHFPGTGAQAEAPVEVEEEPVLEAQTFRAPMRAMQMEDMDLELEEEEVGAEISGTETLTATNDGNGVASFQASSFSVYAVIGSTITKDVVVASGDILRVTVTVTDGNDIARLDDLRVDELASDSDAYQEAYDAVVAAKETEDSGFNAENLGFLAADIALLDRDGNEFEPDGAVNVKIEMISLPADADILTSTLEVQHLTERNGEIEVQTVATNDEVAVVDDVITAEFSVDSFSRYTLTWQGDGSSSGVSDDEARGTLNINGSEGDTYATVIVHYVDVFGHNIASPLTTSVSGVTPVTLAGLLNPEIEDYEYEGIYYNYNAVTGEGDDQAISSITVTRTPTQTTGTVYDSLGTASDGRINYSTSAPSGYTEFYSDANGNTRIYWNNRRFRTTNQSSGTRYNGPVYGARTTTVDGYSYELRYDNAEIEPATYSTAGTWEGAAEIYVVYRSTKIDEGQKATIHWGTFDGEDFVELKTPVSLDTNASTVNLKINMGPDVIDTSAGKQGEAGWYYVGAVYRAPGAENQNLSSTVLRKNNDVWQVKLVGQTQWTNIENGSHIYVNYAPKGSGGYTPPDPPPADVLAPETKKDVTPNGDGTFTIRLDVIGKEDSSTTQIGANVIIVMDITQSMTNQMPDGSGSRMDAAKRALNTLITTLDPDTNLINFNAVNFGNSGNYSAGVGWTTQKSEMTSYVDGLPANDYGTCWQAGLAGGIDRANQAHTMENLKNNETYVLFVTDGNPNCYTDNNGNWQPSTGPGFNQYAYNAAVPNANTLAGISNFYGIFVGDDDGYGHLNDLVTEAGGVQVINGSTTSAIESAFEQIAQTIVENLGAGSVSVDDGVPTLATVGAAVTSGEARDFEYYITPKDGTQTTWTDAPGASYSNSNGVTWDLSQAGTLKDGWTYTLKFDVWPSQAAYDLIADLNNGVVDYDDLTEEQQDAIEGSKETGYTMKTNTHLYTTFKDLDGNEYRDESGYTEEHMNLPTETLLVKKIWNNPYDPDVHNGGAGVDLYLTKDGEIYLDGEHAIHVTAVGADGVLDTEDDWISTEDIYISCGQIVTGDDGYHVLETGHDYKIAEPESFAYHWDLKSEIYRPMVINGTAHYLIQDDDATGTEGTDYFIIEGHKYVISSGSGSNVLTAVNDRRSSLDLTKVVNDLSEDQGADPDELFEYICHFTADEDIYFSAYAGGYQELEGTNIQKEIDTTKPQEEWQDENGWTGYYYATAGSTFSFKIKAGWNVRFMNLPVGTDYTITEGEMAEGYSIEGAEGSGWNFTTSQTESYEVTLTGQTITGTMLESNHRYTITVTNKYEPTGVELIVEKVWQSEDLVTAHGNVTVAIFKDLNADGEITFDEYIDGSVRNMEAPDFAPVTYTKLSSLDGIVVREVVVTTEGTGEDAVTTVTPIDPSGKIVVSGETPTIGTEGNTYVVTYTPGTEANNARTDTVTNTLSTKTVTVTKAFSGIDALPTGFQIVNDYNETVFNVRNKVSGTGSSAAPYTWTIPNVPEGTTIVFTESNIEDDKYDLTAKAKVGTAEEAALTVTGNAASADGLTVTDDDYEVAFTNAYVRHTGTLEITKATDPESIADDKPFKVSIKNSENEYLQNTSEITFNTQPVWFEVSVNEPLTIENLPTDTYTVVEDTTTTQEVDGKTVLLVDIEGYRYDTTSYSPNGGSEQVTKGETATVAITNKYTKLTEATVIKDLRDNFAKGDEVFTFYAKLTEEVDGEEQNITADYLGSVETSGDYEGYYKFTLRGADDESTVDENESQKTFSGLPVGAKLTVKEEGEETAGNVYTVVNGGSGGISLDEDSTKNSITITNIRKTGNLTITKQALFNESPIAEAATKEYTVTVQFEDKRYVSQGDNGLSLVTVPEDGTVPILKVTPSQPLSLTGLPIGEYTVVEDTTTTQTVDGKTVLLVDIEGYLYNDTDYSPETGTATVPSGDEGATIAITNNYTKLATVTVKKNVVGPEKDQTATYTFSQTNLADEGVTFSLIGSDDTTTTGVTENETVFTDIPYGTVISITETGVTIGDEAGSLNEYETTIEATYKDAENSDQPYFDKKNDTATGDITIAGDTTVIYTNSRKQQNVSVLKMDETLTNLLSGTASFALYDGDAVVDGKLVDGAEPIQEGNTTNGIWDLGALDVGSYYLVETEAPDGYIPVTTPIAITIGASAVTYTIDGSTHRAELDPDTNSYQIKVPNRTGYALPHTGGVGTTVYTASGIAMILLAAALLIAKRRRA